MHTLTEKVAPLTALNYIIMQKHCLRKQKGRIMIKPDIEKQLMKLTVKDRAKLANKLLKSLENLSDVENETLWAEEAMKRHEEIVKGKAKSIKADLVFKQGKAKLK